MLPFAGNLAVTRVVIAQVNVRGTLVMIAISSGSVLIGADSVSREPCRGQVAQQQSPVSESAAVSYMRVWCFDGVDYH